MAFLTVGDNHNLNKEVVIKEISTFEIDTNLTKLVPEWTDDQVAKYLVVKDFTSSYAKKVYVVDNQLVATPDMLVAIKYQIPTIVNASTTISFQVKQYDGSPIDTSQYNINVQVQDGSYEVNGSTISWSLPSITENYKATKITVWLTNSSGQIVSNVVSKDITIKQYVLLSDNAIDITSFTSSDTSYQNGIQLDEAQSET